MRARPERRPRRGRGKPWLFRSREVFRHQDDRELGGPELRVRRPRDEYVVSRRDRPCARRHGPCDHAQDPGLVAARKPQRLAPCEDHASDGEFVAGRDRAGGRGGPDEVWRPLVPQDRAQRLLDVKLARLSVQPCASPVVDQIGRASCRERVEISVVAVSLKKKKNISGKAGWQRGCSWAAGGSVLRGTWVG